VSRAAPIFSNPITAIPTSRGNFNAADSRFPDFPTAPSGPFRTSYDLICQPQLNSTDVIECEATSNNAPTEIQIFKSATANPTASPNYFPFVGGAPWSPICELNPVGNQVQCLVTSMTVKKNGSINADMLVKSSNNPVEIFLSNNMTIESGSKLSGDKDDWSRFRIFGASSGTSCPPPSQTPSQTITISSFTNGATTPATEETNLQHAFLWLKTGKLESTTPALTSTPGLVGFVCQNNLAGDAISSNLPNRKFFEGLGGAYKFQGVFGALTPGDPPRIRFFYRGFGYSEQSISAPP
jgi:hypothetical protein